MGRTMTSEYEGKLYLSVVETAKLVRKALKREFPTTKFSVRSDSYAGGAAIRVSWTDGPTTKKVEAVVGCFAGADFDGSIDLKTYTDHWLNPDGTVTVAHARGTEGSKGYLPEVIGDPTSPGAKLVSFGADFVQTDREVSDEHKEAAKREIAAFLGKSSFDECAVNGRLPVSTFRDDDGVVKLAHDSHRGEWADSVVWQMVCLRDFS